MINVVGFSHIQPGQLIFAGEDRYSILVVSDSIPYLGPAPHQYDGDVAVAVSLRQDRLRQQRI